MASGSKVTLRGRFSAGASTTLFARQGNSAFEKAHAGSPLARKRVDADGSVTFDGLEPGQYWIASDDDGVWRGVAVTVKGLPPVPVPRPEKPVEKLSAQQVRDRLAETRPGPHPGQLVEGVRSTANIGPVARKPAAAKKPAAKKKTTK